MHLTEEKKRKQVRDVRSELEMPDPEGRAARSCALVGDRISALNRAAYFAGAIPKQTRRRNFGFLADFRGKNSG